MNLSTVPFGTDCAESIRHDINWLLYQPVMADREYQRSVYLKGKSSMRMAARIRQIRLERWVSLERLEAQTGLAKSLLARLEKGQEVPTLETLDNLADALGVPVHRFFYNDGEPPLTPRL